MYCIILCLWILLEGTWVLYWLILHEILVMIVFWIAFITCWNPWLLGHLSLFGFDSRCLHAYFMIAGSFKVGGGLVLFLGCVCDWLADLLDLSFVLLFGCKLVIWVCVDSLFLWIFNLGLFRRLRVGLVCIELCIWIWMKLITCYLCLLQFCYFTYGLL